MSILIEGFVYLVIVYIILGLIGVCICLMCRSKGGRKPSLADELRYVREMKEKEREERERRQRLHPLCHKETIRDFDY